MHHGRVIPSLVAGLACALVACSSGSGPTTKDIKNGGIVAVRLNETPSDVQCLEVNVMSSSGAVTIQTQRFDVTPNQSATLELTGLPLEWVLLAEKAYNAPCSQVTSSTPATWYSPSATSVRLINGEPVSVTIVLHPATGPGGVSVTTDFRPAPTTCQGWVCSPWDYGTGNACNCNCGCWDPDCDATQVTDGGTGGLVDAGGVSSTILGCSNWQTCVQPGVCQDVACVGWTCPRSWYGDGFCQSWCGCPDVDCSSQDAGADVSPNVDTNQDGAIGPGPDAGGDAGGPTCATCVWGQTFESNNGGFTVSGALTTWAHGVSATPGFPQEWYGKAHSGSNVWATNLTGNYRANEDGYLTSPAINLAGYTGRAITLSWWQALNGCSSTTAVEVSKDQGQTWNEIYAEDCVFYSQFTKKSVVLNSSYAVSNFQFRFHFLASSYIQTYPGWYIDDVCVALGGLGVYSTDFEQDGAGFTLGTPPWSYGAPVTGPKSAHSGSQAWATNLTGTYDNAAEYVLTSPAINLSALASEASIALRWWDWLESEPTYDVAHVDVMADGLPWSEVWSASGPMYPWSQRSVTLNRDYAKSGFQVRFRFTSDSVNSYRGWFLDDLSIQGTTLDSCDPIEDTPTGPDPQTLWRDKSGVPAIMIADPNAPSGGWVQRLDRAISGGDYFSPAIPVTAGQTYCVAADIKWVGGGTPFIGIQRSNGSYVEWLMGSAYVDAFGPTTVVDPADTGWQHLTREIVMPAGTTQVQLVNELFDGARKAGDHLAYFDVVSITAGACAGAVWLDKNGVPAVMVADPTAPSGGPVQMLDRIASGGDYFSPAIAVTAGQTYCVAADIKWVGGGTPFIGIQRSNSLYVEWLMGSAYTDAYGPTTVVDPLISGWQHLTREIVMPAGTTQVQLVNELFGGVAKSGASLAYFDRVLIGAGACP